MAENLLDVVIEDRKETKLLESVFATVCEALLVLDEDLRVVKANRSFYEEFKVPPDETLGRSIYQLGNGQWDIPALKELLEKILPQNMQIQNFKVEQVFPGIGQKTMLLNATRLRDEGEKILLAIDDITEHQKIEEKLKASEVRYRRLFEAAHDGIIILDPTTHQITDSNPFMSSLLGFSREELIGKELWEIGLLKDEESSRKAFEDLLRTGRIRYEDLPLRTKSGEAREVEFVSNVYEEDGSQVIQCNIRDITERKEAEQTKFFLGSIVQSSTDSIMTLDLNGIITTWNKSAERIYGYPAAEVIGKPLTILELPEDFAVIQNALEKVKRGEPVERLEMERVQKDAHHIYVGLQFSPIRNAKGEIIGILTISTDITPRKRAEKALKEAKQKIDRHAEELEKEIARRTFKLNESIRFLEGFCYSIAHELKAPLRAMDGFANVLLEDHEKSLRGEPRIYVERIIEASRRMNGLINDLLTYGRLGHLESSLETLDLALVMSKVLAQLKPEIDARKAGIEISHPLLKIKGNALFVEKILCNLISNALKFSKPGIPPEIQIRTEKRGAMTRVSVQDNGIGIKPEYHQKILGVFERLDQAQPGSGIGLAIVQKAVARMDGKFGFDSRYGEGSTFWFELPE